MKNLATTPSRIQRAVTAIVNSKGIKSACKTFNLGEKTMFKVMAGVTVTKGTLAIVEDVLERLGKPVIADSVGGR